MLITAITATTGSRGLVSFKVKCSDSKPRRGFGTRNNHKNTKANKITTSREENSSTPQQRTLKNNKTAPLPTQAPGLSSRYESKSNAKFVDIEFEERLEAVRRSALEQKKADEIKEFGPIDYDAPVASENKTIGLGTKIGVGVAVLVFGLVFALGDFLPSGSDISPEEVAVVDKKLSKEEKATLQTRLKEYEKALGKSPKDHVALEGAAVTLAELGDYTQATTLLQDLAKAKPNDPDVFRLLGEVKYALKDYEGSAAAYKLSTAVSERADFEVLRGLTDALLAAKKPGEAVQVLLAAREGLNSEKSTSLNGEAENTPTKTETEILDPIQVDLLLGKAYSDWGHVSDAISVYDQLISSHPNDFRGYLAKGIILKENGSVGDAERMFIQARFFAPEKAKAFVARYAKR